MVQYVFLGRVDAAPKLFGELMDAVRKMPERIPGIVDLSMGVPEDPEKCGGYNWGVTIRFTDWEARKAYSTHPYHKQIGKTYGHLVLDKITMNFEC